MTEIKVPTSKGEATHGFIHNGIFKRYSNNKIIRFSDLTFPLNPAAAKILEVYNCHTIKYIIELNGSTIEYTMAFDQATTYPRVTNEYGDTDIRIPVKDFKSETSNLFFVRQEEIESEHQLCLEL